MQRAASAGKPVVLTIGCRRPIDGWPPAPALGGNLSAYGSGKRLLDEPHDSSRQHQQAARHQILFIEASMGIQKCEKVGLVGSNGAGKTTLSARSPARSSQATAR